MQFQHAVHIHSNRLGRLCNRCPGLAWCIGKRLFSAWRILLSCRWRVSSLQGTSCPFSWCSISPSGVGCCRCLVCAFFDVFIVIFKIIQQSNKCKGAIQPSSCSGTQCCWTYFWCSQATLPDSPPSSSLSPWLSTSHSCCSMCSPEFYSKNWRQWRCNTHRPISSSSHILSFWHWEPWQWFHYRWQWWWKFRG